MEAAVMVMKQIFDRMPKTATQKMSVKPGMRAFLLHVPPDVRLVEDLPGLNLKKPLTGLFDYMHVFVQDEKTFQRDFPRLKAHLAPGGMLWVSWPKAGQLGSGLNIKQIIAMGYDFGLVESNAISIDTVWSALKFTHPKPGKIYHNSYGKLNRESGH